MRKFNSIILFYLITTLTLGLVISATTVPQISHKYDEPLEKNNPLQTVKSSASPKKWTFMVYLDADCNLEGAGIDDINEMEMEGSDSNINVIVQIDRIPDFDDSEGDWTGAKRYYIIKDYDSDAISSTVVQDLGEVNMGSTSTLQSFIQWGKSTYPADNYALILWDHGSGAMWGSSPGGVCWDDSNSHDYLTLSELSSILSNPTYSVDLLGFDACLMGAVEVHYQLKDYVDVIIGSEETEPGDGYPYDDILNYLRIIPTATPQQLGQQIVITYDDSYPSNWDITQAAVNSLTTEYINSLNAFINDLDDIAISQKSEIETARDHSQEFDEVSYVDLYDFAVEVQTECSGPVDDSAQYLMDNISHIVIEERHSDLNPDANGLSIYFPEVLSGYSSNYETLSFASDLQWDEFLRKFLTGGMVSGYDDEYEENDDFSEAEILTPGSYNLICNASDYDFFNVSLQAGNVIEIDLLFDHDEGDLDLYLCNTSQNLVDWSESYTDNEKIIYMATENGYHSIVIAQYEPYQEYQSYLLDIIIDDPFEENDDPYSSAFIENNTLYTDLVSRDYDFYYFWATENYLINVTIEFNYIDGDLDLYLYDDYLHFLGASYTATNHENILFSANYSGWYIIGVYNYSNNFNYLLWANVSYVDDPFETSHGLSNNNYIDYATPIPYGDYTDLVCMNDDFYNISLTIDIWINITLYFDDDEGDLDICLIYVNSWTPFDYDVVGFSSSYTDDEVIYYEVEATGYYYIWIMPYEFNFNYTLCIHETTLVWDDDYENNDWFDDAPLLTLDNLYDNLTAIDWDTFYFYAQAGSQITITLDYRLSDGDLDLYLIDYDDINDIGWILDYSTFYTDQDEIVFDVSSSGNYYILVYPYEMNMHYNLTLSKTIPTSVGGGGGGGGGGSGGETAPISGIPILLLTLIIGITSIFIIKKKRIICLKKP